MYDICGKQPKYDQGKDLLACACRYDYFPIWKAGRQQYSGHLQFVKM